MHRNTRSGGLPPQKDHITPAPMYFAADAVVVVVVGGGGGATAFASMYFAADAVVGVGAITFASIVLGCEVIAHCFESNTIQ